MEKRASNLKYPLVVTILRWQPRQRFNQSFNAKYDEKGRATEEAVTGRDVKERELNDEQRGGENRDAGRRETWLFSACRHRLFPPFPPMFKVNKLAKHSINQAKCQSEKEVETERGMKETCRQTELLPSDVLDGSI